MGIARCFYFQWAALLTPDCLRVSVIYQPFWIRRFRMISSPIMLGIVWRLEWQTNQHWSVDITIANCHLKSILGVRFVFNCLPVRFVMLANGWSELECNIAFAPCYDVSIGRNYWTKLSRLVEAANKLGKPVQRRCLDCKETWCSGRSFNVDLLNFQPSTGEAHFKLTRFYSKCKRSWW